MTYTLGNWNDCLTAAMLLGLNFSKTIIEHDLKFQVSVLGQPNCPRLTSVPVH